MHKRVVFFLRMHEYIKNIATDTNNNFDKQQFFRIHEELEVPIGYDRLIRFHLNSRKC